MNSGMSSGDMDPNVLFQAFFGGGGRSSRNSQQMPGGFSFSFG
jgi:hypothetical protein